VASLRRPPLSSGRRRKLTFTRTRTARAHAPTRANNTFKNRIALLPPAPSPSALAATLRDMYLAPKTFKSYASKLKRFEDYHRERGRTPYAPDFNFDDALAEFIASEATRGLSANTLISVASSISSLARHKGLAPSKPVLTLKTLQGLRRLQGPMAFSAKSLPVDAHILDAIFPLVDFTDELQLLAFSALCIGVAGFLRMSELFPSSTYGPLYPFHFFPTSFTSSGVNLTSFTLHLPHAKTDKNGVPSSSRIISNSRAVLCVSALISDNSGPLLAPSSFSARLSCATFRTMVRKWIIQVRPTFSGRFSMRAGKVASLLAAGVDETTIMLAGGWRSSAMRSYLRLNSSTIAASVRH
jgi:hypothetical protein